MGQSSIDYLGHVVNEEGASTGPPQYLDLFQHATPVSIRHDDPEYASDTRACSWTRQEEKFLKMKSKR